MKPFLFVLGLGLRAAAAVYFLVPADALPSFMPGHEAGLARLRVKHGLVSAAGGVLLLAAGWWLWRKAPQPGADADPFPVPPLSSSPFLNTKPEALYVGSEACRSCHEGRHDSFRRTGHGRPMAGVGPAPARPRSWSLPPPPLALFWPPPLNVIVSSPSAP